MLTKKSMLVAGALTTLGAASVLGIHSVSATANTSSDQTIVDKIATKFSLNRDEVQQVFDEEHTARVAEMESRTEERLNKAVEEGKLTEEQKTKILDKLKEMKSQMESELETFKDMTPEERHEKMETRRTELEAWAKDNGIPIEYLRITHKFKGHGGGHGSFHMQLDGSAEKPLHVHTEHN